MDEEEKFSGLRAEDQDLDQLLELARDRSSQSRARLVGVLSDLFMDDNRTLSARERELMTEILRQLVHDVEKVVRHALADRLATFADAPRELVATLANDEIEVAHPILLHSEVLRDLELIEIVEHQSMQHQLAIAMRGSLSEAVTDSLVEVGDSEVVKTVIENLGAVISPATMATLVEESELVEAYQAPLLNRSDLPPRLAKQMYWWVSAALRKHIANNFDIDSAELDNRIVGAVKDLIGDDGDEIHDGIDALVDKVAESEKITPQLLIKTLRHGQIALFEAMLAKLVGLRKQLIRRFIFESGGEALAIACKSAEIYKADFASIFLLSRGSRPGEKVVDPGELSKAVMFFDRLRIETARKVVERWHLDPNYLNALRLVENAA